MNARKVVEWKSGTLENWIKMRNSEYDVLYGLKNKATGKLILTYRASSQTHKALFSSRKKAEEALFWFEDDEVEIVEFKG